MSVAPNLWINKLKLAGATTLKTKIRTDKKAANFPLYNEGGGREEEEIPNSGIVIFLHI